MKMWMILSLDTQIDWPGKETEVTFDGKTLILRPPTTDAATDIRIQFDHPEGEIGAYETVCRFLSALCWFERRGARIVDRTTCTAGALRLGRGPTGPPKWDGFALSEKI